MTSGANDESRDLTTRSSLEPQIVRQALEMLIAGKTPDEVADEIGGEWPDVNPRELFDAVGRRFDLAHAASVERTIGWALEAYRDLYRSARDAGDIKAAITAVSKLVELKRGTFVLDD